jgi:hypothetical protein
MRVQLVFTDRVEEIIQAETIRLARRDNRIRPDRHDDFARLGAQRDRVNCTVSATSRASYSEP